LLNDFEDVRGVPQWLSKYELNMEFTYTNVQGQRVLFDAQKKSQLMLHSLTQMTNKKTNDDGDNIISATTMTLESDKQDQVKLNFEDLDDYVVLDESQSPSVHFQNLEKGDLSAKLERYSKGSVNEKQRERNSRLNSATSSLVVVPISQGFNQAIHKINTIRYERNEINVNSPLNTTDVTFKALLKQF